MSKLDDLLKEARELTGTVKSSIKYSSRSATLYKQIDDHIMETGELPSEWSKAVHDHRYQLLEPLSRD